MYQEFVIDPPFFEIGPKAYLYGNEALKLAKEADRISKEFNVRIIFTPQYVDIPIIARETEHIFVFAQHMDSLEIGRGVGSVLPEAIKEAGAVGVLLNHSEKRMTLSEINRTIKRADSVGLATLVCADTPEEAVAIAHLGPNILLVESPELIGKENTKVSDRSYVCKVNEMVKSVNPRIQVLHSAGIFSGKDVYDIVMLGAEATGSTSGIIKAKYPYQVMEDMIQSMRKAWDQIHP